MRMNADISTGFDFSFGFRSEEGEKEFATFTERGTRLGNGELYEETLTARERDLIVLF
jgi:hypothetical protein